MATKNSTDYIEVDPGIDVSELFDAVIVGGGPAGLTAALYLARARYRVVVVEKERFGGQITITEEVVNYPGVFKTSGAALTDTMKRQAESFGAEFMLAEVTGFESAGSIKTVHTTRGDLKCFSVLLALGSTPRQIGFKGEEEFRGHGVAYCATCDGEFFTGKDVFVIGGGFAAAEESVFLTKYAKHVHILFRKGDFSCAPAAAEAAKSNDKITLHPFTVVEELQGDSLPRVLRYKNVQTGDIEEYHASEGDTFGVFVLAGYDPATNWLKGVVSLSDQGNIEVDTAQRTSVEGIYAAGDVCIKDLRQVVTATGEAASAATHMERYIANLQKETGLVPQQPRLSAKVARKHEGQGIIEKDGTAQTRDRDLQHAAQDKNVGAFDRATSGDSASNTEEANSLLSAEMIAQLQAVFNRMEQPVVLRLYLDDRAVSQELRAYAEELAALTDNVKVSLADDKGEDKFPDDAGALGEVKTSERPCVRVCLEDGTYTGLAFHGAPGGHEFTSFVLGLYNAAGPGQPLADDDRAAIEAIALPQCIQILVSLSCTMCPDTVVAAQRIASINPQITAEAFDINHFPDLKDKYQVMSVPCVVVNNGERVVFGKKNIQQMLDLVK